MNPIPLAAPDGRIYAYACAHCHNVSASSHIVAGIEGHDGPDPDHAERSQQDALECCTCKRCGAVRGSFGEVCEACGPAYEAERQAANEAWQAEQAPARARRDAAYKAALERSTDGLIAENLRYLISDLSETHWFAGWMSECEHTFWEMVQGGSRDSGWAGGGEVAERDIAELRELHERCGGWWYWDNDVTAALFIPTAAWVDRHEAWQRRQSDGAR